MEAESLPEQGEGQEGQEEQPVSRIVVEFTGLGMADIHRTEMENVSLGQMMVFAQYAEWQCRRAIAQFERQQREAAERKAQLQGIIVPRGRVT